MKNNGMSRLLGVIVLFSLFGCGGGSGGGGTGSSIVTVLVKTVQLSGTAGPFYGVQFKADLPVGVSLNTVGNDLADGVLKASGGAVGSNVGGSYQTTTTSQILSVSVTSSPDGLGFPSGEFLAINCTVAPGTVFDPATLAFSEFKVFDNSGAIISDVKGVVMLK